MCIRRAARIADPRFREITVHQLLFHGGGLPHDIEGGHDERGEEQAYRALREKPLLFDPGTEHRYSNAGFIVLRLVIERASGQRYEPFIKQHILRPMGIEQMHLEPERGYGPRETHRYLPGGQLSGASQHGQLARLERGPRAVRRRGRWRWGRADVSPPEDDGADARMSAVADCVGQGKSRGPHVGLGWDTAEVFPNGTYRFSKNGGKPGVEAWLEHLETGIDWALFFNTGRQGGAQSAGRSAQSDVWRSPAGSGPGLSRRDFDCRRSLRSRSECDPLAVVGEFHASGSRALVASYSSEWETCVK